ncbi:MAG: hypothetical protein ACYDA4_14435, partial [Ignavibacteriaceae bacterium]
KLCKVKKLNKLVELEYLQNTYEDVYFATDKVMPLLHKNGYQTKLLPKNINGLGKENELNNTEVFIQALNFPDYKALLYPVFSENNTPYLKPDALLVRAKDGAYKLEFLEVEASKPDWDNWLENKRINYLKLAKDNQAYSYWKTYCSYLSLPVPNIKDFKFSVSIIGNVKKDFGQGFNFIEHL